MLKTIALVSSLATGYTDINETITFTEQILIKHCIEHKEDCNKEALVDIELVKQLDGVY